MLAGPQDHPVDRVLVHLQQARGGTHANPLGRMVAFMDFGLSKELSMLKKAVSDFAKKK